MEVSIIFDPRTGSTEGLTDNREVPLSVSQSTYSTAVLSIRHSAKLLSALSKGAMRKLMLEQYGLWFNHICELGRDIELHDMIFVTDCHLTSDWAIGVYAQTYTEGSIISRIRNFIGSIPSTRSETISKRTTVNIPFRYGPDHRRVMRSLQSQEEDIDGASEDKQNQCIFLKGFHAAERDGLLKIKLKAAAEPQSPDMDRDSSSGPKIMMIEEHVVSTS